MRVTISTPGRFQPAYVWAAFLEQTGQLERIMTPLPHRTVVDFGVSRGATVSLIPFAGWAYAMRRLGRWVPPSVMDRNQLVTMAAFDQTVARMLGECHVFNGWAGASLATMRAARRRGTPTVLQTGSAHMLTQVELLRRETAKYGVEAPLPHPTIVRRTLQEYEEADVIVVPSAFVRRTFVDRGVAPDRLVTVPWAALPVADPRQPLQFSDGPDVTILFVGGCALRKGVPYLLEAARLLGSEGRIRMVGSQNPTLVARLGGLPRNVEAVGVKRGAGLREELRAADIFVLPSVEDGSALVIMEAMLAGLPVVVSDQAGAALVTDAESGYIVPACDSAALADRLLALVRDVDLRRRMGKAARAVAAPRTPEVYGTELVKHVYRPLVRDGDFVPQVESPRRP